jgi:hypothetical protein
MPENTRGGVAPCRVGYPTDAVRRVPCGTTGRDSNPISVKNSTASQRASVHSVASREHKWLSALSICSGSNRAPSQREDDLELLCAGPCPGEAVRPYGQGPEVLARSENTFGDRRRRGLYRHCSTTELPMGVSPPGGDRTRDLSFTRGSNRSSYATDRTILSCGGLTILSCWAVVPRTQVAGRRSFTKRSSRLTERIGTASGGCLPCPNTHTT